MQPVPVNEPLLLPPAKEYVNECLETGWISSEGPFVQRFEEEMAAQAGRRFGIAVANGTAALEIAVQALKLGPGDEVILPAFCILSCAQAVVRAGATPVLVDNCREDYNLLVDEVEAAITPRTRAVMAVHTYGLPVDMPRLEALCGKHGLALIEDSAESIGQSCGGRMCGSYGQISTFSFYANKHITTGEGGMCVTDDEELAGRCRSLRNLCFQPERRFFHEEMGWNYRLTNLQAALGCAQLQNLPRHLEIKRGIGAAYQELLAHRSELQLPLPSRPYADNLYWVFPVLVRPESPLAAPELMEKLRERKIGTRPFFWPMHEQPVFQQRGLFEGQRFPNAEHVARHGFYLPSGLALSREQAGIVSEAIDAIFQSA